MDTRHLRNLDESSSERNSTVKLNHDCLSKVFMYLPVLERLEMEKVCQKWKEATEFSWHDVKKLDFIDTMVTLDKKEELTKMILMRCCRYLTHLKIDESHYQYPWISDVLKNNCQNIIHFDIDLMIENNEYKISNEDIVEIIISMKLLKYLKLSRDLQDSSNIYSQILDKLPDHMEEIHLLVRRLAYQYNEVVPVLDRFNNLRCLTLHGFCLTNATIVSTFQNINTLVKLDLSVCKFPTGVSPIFTKLKNLECLILFLVEKFEENLIIQIVRNCSKLKHFEFMMKNNHTLLPADVPYRIFRELRFLNLEHIHYFGIDKSSNDSENQISVIANNWKQLKHLNVHMGRDFSAFDFREITKFKNLEFLNLLNATVDSQSFINIANNCLELKELLMNFREIPEPALEKLINLKKLEKLNVIHCNITGDLLSKIANNCTNLVDLNLESCHGVTEDSLIQVGKLKYLKRLNVNNIANVPNAMFDNFRNLEDLSCFLCPTVTDEGVIKLLDNCNKLCELKLWETGITVRTLIHASKRQFVFTPLDIWVDLFVKNDYTRNISTPSPYLRIH